MAKVSLTKLGLKVNQEIKTIEFNEQVIEVKQYLPLNDKLELISNIINLSADDNNFVNPIKVKVFTTLEMIYAYTNINFTDKQKEDGNKLYDLLVSSGLASTIFELVPEQEKEMISKSVAESIEAIYKYRNSVLGILDSVTTDYSDLNLEANEIYKTIADPNNLTLLKDIVTKLG